MWMTANRVKSARQHSKKRRAESFYRVAIEQNFQPRIHFLYKNGEKLCSVYQIERKIALENLLLGAD